MNEYQKKSPYFIILFFVTLLFALGSIYPYQITADLGFQMKSVQQFLRHESSLFNSVTLPSSQNLSQDVEAWITWWPPGIPAVFFPLIALGLPLGIAARVTSYFLFLLGCLGWLKFAQKINVNQTTLIIVSFILPLHAISLGSVTELIGDVVPFALIPWLLMYTVYIAELLNCNDKINQKIWIHSIFLCSLLGLVYWIKYSAFTVSASAFIYLAFWGLFLAKKRKRNLLKALTWAGCCFMSFISLPSLLIFLNQLLTGAADFVAQAETFKFTDPTTKGMSLILSLFGAPGIALFQASNWLMHVIYFNNTWSPWLANLSYNWKAVPFAIAGIPGTIFILWLLSYARKIYSKIHIIFIFALTFLPLLALGYLSFKIGYNFLVYNLRYTVAYFGIAEIVLISALLNLFKSSLLTKSKFIIYSSLIMMFLIVPNLFTLSYFIKDKIIDRTVSTYTTTENKLYVPSLSHVNAKMVVEQIDAVTQSEKDVVVLALEQAAPFDAWLEMKHRTLPLVQAWGPLVQTHGREGANIYGSSQYKSLEKLRVVLVISKSLEEDKTFLKNLKKRFPQALNWQQGGDIENSDSLVSILYSDLKVENS